VYFGLLLILSVAGIVFVVLLPAASPPPPDMAKDPLLVVGRELYLKNCATCHGDLGRGDGPNAKNLKGRGPGNLTDPASWRQGASAAAVVKVISQGSPGTSMPGWALAFKPKDVRAVAAYVYYLARRPVPEELRNGD
jgi:cytochrome c oxidase cbb3-type subunit 3